MIPSRRHLLLAIAAATTSGLVTGAAAADAVDEALGQVTKARASLRTLQASFRQKRLIGLLATAVESTGKLSIVRPDRLRWELAPPDAVTYWIGPEGLAMANADGVTKVNKAAAGRFASVLSDLMVMIGGDMSTLRKRYELSVEQGEDRFALTAKPKTKNIAKQVAELRMEVGPKLWMVKRIEIAEANGDRSIIDFGSVTRDKAIKPELMKPPTG